MKSIYVVLNLASKLFIRCKFAILSFALVFSIGSSSAQQYYFESKPFNPLIDTTKQRLGLSFDVGRASKLNFHVSYSINRNISAFIGGNIQDGSRDWETLDVGIGNPIKYHTELSNGGRYGGFSFYLPFTILEYKIKSTIQVGIEHFKVDNSSYNKDSEDRIYEITKTSYNNIFIQAAFPAYEQGRFSLIANSRFSSLHYGNFNYYESTNNQIDNKSIVNEKNLNAIWAELGPSINYHFDICNLFGQLNCSFPLKDIEYASKGLSSFDVSINVGLQFLLDLKKSTKTQSPN